MSENKTEDKKEEKAKLEEKKIIEPVTLEKINELLTNNLKWSQIIYEQNRKINNKLFWSSVFSYLKVAFIVIPLIIGFIYLMPNINNFFNVLDSFSSINTTKEDVAGQNALIDALLKQLPFDQSKQEQIKALLR